MLEGKYAITNEVLEPITFVLPYPTALIIWFFSPPFCTVFLSGPYIVTITLISAAINILAFYSENIVFRSKTNGRDRSLKNYIAKVSKPVVVEMAFCISVRRSPILTQVTRSCIHSSKRIPALGLKLVRSCYSSHTFEFLNHTKVDVK
jgi:hypothetical protein